MREKYKRVSEQPTKTAGISSSNNSYDSGLTLKQLLLWTTMLNVVFFLGGSIFTATKVSSIQDRYNQAEIKIEEAQKQYSDAKKRLESVSLLERNVTQRLNQISENGEKLQNKLDSQYQLVVRKRDDVTERMNVYLKESDLELKKVANQLIKKLNGDIKVQVTSIEQIKEDIKLVKEKAIESDEEIIGIQKEVAEQLDTLDAIKTELKDKIDTFSNQSNVSIIQVWNMSDILLRCLLVLFPTIVILLLTIILKKRSK